MERRAASPHTIALARASDLDRLPAIERAAAMLLRDHAPPSILVETTETRVLRDAHAHGRLWVGLVDAVPVGFALVDMLAPDLPHLEELDVHPAHGRRGIGTALVRAVCAWAARAGYAAVSLTTFRAVPWNMPFYARLGFVEVPTDALRPELAAVVAAEAARGLEPRARVVMVWRAP